MTTRVLVLGGTAEARQLCQLLAREPDVQCTASLAGVTRRPEDYGVPVRTGGFGGMEGLAKFIASEQIDFLVDATHPFATEISASAPNAAQWGGAYFAILRRPAWSVDPAWRLFTNPKAALEALPDHATAFLAIGSYTIGLLAEFAQAELYLRVIDPPQKPFPNLQGGFVVARPPFDVSEEEDLFRSLGVTHLVCRNSGGQSGFAKLAAAQALGITVHMIVRPPEPALQNFVNVDCQADAKAMLDHIRGIVAKR